MADPHAWSLHNPPRHAGHQAHRSELPSRSVDPPSPRRYRTGRSCIPGRQSSSPKFEEEELTERSQQREETTSVRLDHSRQRYVSPMSQHAASQAATLKVSKNAELLPSRCSWNESMVFERPSQSLCVLLPLFHAILVAYHVTYCMLHFTCPIVSEKEFYNKVVSKLTAKSRTHVEFASWTSGSFQSRSENIRRASKQTKPGVRRDP